MPLSDVRVPDLGDFEDVEVIEILVSPGDRIEVDDSLVTLESEKATMELPSPAAGVVSELSVALGDRVSEGQLLLTLEVAEAEDTDPRTSESEGKASPTLQSQPPGSATEQSPPASAALAAESDTASDTYDLVVLGGGPGGYTAAFRAADLGLRVALVERDATLGGVCLNVGCIPSKALLHVAEVVTEARELADRGIDFGEPSIDVDKLRAYKDKVVGRLTGGLSSLAKQRHVDVVRGVGTFRGSNEIAVRGPAQADQSLRFESAIVAVGSSTVELPGLPYDDPRVLDSTTALELPDIPRRLLVIGGGIIGLEMAAVFHALGSEVSVVELFDDLLMGVDRDVVAPLERLLRKRYAAVWTGTRLLRLESESDGLHAHFEGKDAPEQATFDRVLVAVGRRPNGKDIAADAAGVAVDERGFIAVDETLRTNVPHIFAIGDVVGQPMLAHKATHQGKVAAETIAGLASHFSPGAVPSVAYTDPEVAWMGLSETEAKEAGRPVRVEKFPWAASGRALGVGRSEGLTKLLFDAETGRLAGAAIVGAGAGELIAECVLALEMGADAEDLALTIHPHPTLSESVGFAAEMAHGSITDLLPRKRPPREGQS